MQTAFAGDDLRVVVATVAFGLGIDKSNVRFVVHYDLPKNLESYYQETGRSGRDGLPAQALLLFGLGDAAVARSLIERSANPEQIRIESHKLNSMVGFAEATTCRRRVLLGYLGEPLEHDCGNCDVCLEPPDTYDATEHARMALSTVAQLDQRFGIGYVVDVLRGSENERILRFGHDGLGAYGIGADLSKEEWQGLIRQLIHRGYLTQDVARYSVLRLTERARPLLDGDEELVLARPRVRPPTAKAEARAKKAAARAEARAAGAARARPDRPTFFDEADVDERLFAQLRTLRKQLADKRRVPAYVVFSDASLREMAAARPTTPEALLSVNGVGEKKLEKYGDVFLELIRDFELTGA